MTDETEAHVLSMAAIPGAAAHALWRAKRLQADYPEYAGLVARVEEVTGKEPPGHTLKVGNDANAYTLPKPTPAPIVPQRAAKRKAKAC